MNPFVGLRPFREDERHLFVGRELATAYVETKSSLNPLTLLIARSGIGKSSFLTSRLIPHLREISEVHYINEWGGAPDRIVSDGIKRLKTRAGERRTVGYLILDQFEDIFKQDINRREIWDSFAEVISSDGERVRIVVTMREEWLGAWEEVEQYVPNAFGSLVRLAPLTQKELRNAIVKPIESDGHVSVSGDLVPIVLQDLRRQNAFGLGEGFVEPGMLQLVCHRLWQEAYATPERVIDHALYERLGFANQIIEEFVWRHLRGGAGSQTEFLPDQRVLWAGLVKHLSLAHGIKVTVTPDSLANKLLLSDLGVAGSAMAARHGRAVQVFLKKTVEKRESVPPRLTAWLGDTLDKAEKCGFVKKQEGFKSGDPRARLYELTHDSLDDRFRSFALEFEKWAARRVVVLWSILAVVLFVVPFTAVVAAERGFDFAETLTLVLFGMLGMAFYAGVFWVLMKVMPYVAMVSYYPVVRLLVRGQIKSRPRQMKKKK